VTDPKKIIITGGRMVGRASLVKALTELGREVAVIDQTEVEKLRVPCEIPEVSAHPERRKPKKPKRRRLKRKPGRP